MDLPLRAGLHRQLPENTAMDEEGEHLVPTNGFDYARVFKDLDRDGEDGVARLAYALFAIFYWIHQGGQALSNGVMIRSYVFVQCVFPEVYGNVSDVQIASKLQLKCPQSFNREKSKFRKEFGFMARGMRTNETIKKMAEAYVEAHKNDLGIKGYKALRDKMEGKP